MKILQKSIVLALISVLSAGTAQAHHFMDDFVPNSFWTGFLSGLAHPVIGLDHLAFVIAVGLAAALFGSKGRFVLPLLFVVATLGGTFIHLQQYSLPLVEIMIAGGVVVAGALLLSNKNIPFVFWGVVFAGAGLFHGFAYAGSIVGAESTVLTAYLLGFSVVQYVLAAAIALLAGFVYASLSARKANLRFAGAAVAGAGMVFLIENVMTAVLA